MSFLTQLAVALHKLRAYPEGHPLRREAVEATYAILGRILAERDSLRVGVARRQLIVDDLSTDPAHFVIRDLAKRLHQVGLGAICFRSGLTLADFSLGLERLAVDPGRSGSAAAMPVIESGPVELFPIAYDALTLDGQVEADAGNVDRLWQELAHIVATGAAPAEGQGSTGPTTGGYQLQGSEAMAHALMDRLGSPEARGALAATLERLGRTARTLEGDERQAVEVRLGDLLAALPSDALGILLDFDLRRPDGLAALTEAADWLPVTALLDVIESAARAERQEVSTMLLRLLRKLSGIGGAAGSPAPRTDTDVRSIVKDLLSEWTLNDPNPASHTRVLDFLSRHDLPISADGAPTSEGLRLIQIAIETEVFGDPVVEAVDLVLEADQLGQMVALLEQAPADNSTVAAVWRTLCTPATVTRLVQDPRSDLELLGRIVARADGSIVPVLIDALFATADTGRRRVLLRHLANLGSTVPLEILRRIERVGVAERRAFLALLVELPSLPDGFTARAYADSPDPTIRIEAVRLMLRNPDDRADAILAALADVDERVVWVGLEAAREGLPRAGLTRLALLLNNARRSPELRARAVFVLGQFDTANVRQWLLEGMIVRGGWLRRRRLSPKSPVLLARLRVLTSRWPNHPDVQAVHRLAHRSRDPELVEATKAGLLP